MLRTRGVVVAWGGKAMDGPGHVIRRSTSYHRMLGFLLLFFNPSGPPGCLPAGQARKDD